MALSILYRLTKAGINDCGVAVLQSLFFRSTALVDDGHLFQVSIIYYYINTHVSMILM